MTHTKRSIAMMLLLGCTTLAEGQMRLEHAQAPAPEPEAREPELPEPAAPVLLDPVVVSAPPPVSASSARADPARSRSGRRVRFMVGEVSWLVMVKIPARER